MRSQSEPIGEGWCARRDSNPPGPSESEVRRDLEERLGVTTSRREVVRPPRLELGTPGLEGRCSIQLSYGRERKKPF